MLVGFVIPSAFPVNPRLNLTVSAAVTATGVGSNNTNVSLSVAVPSIVNVPNPAVPVSAVTTNVPSLTLKPIPFAPVHASPVIGLSEQNSITSPSMLPDVAIVNPTEYVTS